MRRAIALISGCTTLLVTSVSEDVRFGGLVGVTLELEREIMVQKSVNELGGRGFEEDGV